MHIDKSLRNTISPHVRRRALESTGQPPPMEGANTGNLLSAGVGRGMSVATVPQGIAMDPISLSSLQEPLRLQQQQQQQDRFLASGAGFGGPLDHTNMMMMMDRGNYNPYTYGQTAYPGYLGQQPDLSMGMNPQMSQYLQFLALQRQTGGGYFPLPTPQHPPLGLGLDRFPNSMGLMSVMGNARLDPAAAMGVSQFDLQGGAPMGAPTENHVDVAPSPAVLADGFPERLPVILAQSEDTLKLSSHQVLLRHQIEVFQASEEDVTTHTRGRNKPVVIRQVGIRCRHCAHLPVQRRQKGSTYFPATMLGLYQAAQNMSSTHMQCGLCTEMPAAIKMQFVRLMSTKVASSGAGRPYWADSAKKLGLVDTEEGIYFVRDIPQGVRLKSDSDRDERYKK